MNHVDDDILFKEILKRKLIFRNEFFHDNDTNSIVHRLFKHYSSSETFYNVGESIQRGKSRLKNPFDSKLYPNTSFDIKSQKQNQKFLIENSQFLEITSSFDRKDSDILHSSSQASEHYKNWQKKYDIFKERKWTEVYESMLRLYSDDCFVIWNNLFVPVFVVLHELGCEIQIKEEEHMIKYPSIQRIKSDHKLVFFKVHEEEKFKFIFSSFEKASRFCGILEYFRKKTICQRDFKNIYENFTISNYCKIDNIDVFDIMPVQFSQIKFIYKVGYLMYSISNASWNSGLFIIKENVLYLLSNDKGILYGNSPLKCISRYTFERRPYCILIQSYDYHVKVCAPSESECQIWMSALQQTNFFDVTTTYKMEENISTTIGFIVLASNWNLVLITLDQCVVSKMKLEHVDVLNWNSGQSIQIACVNSIWIINFYESENRNNFKYLITKHLSKAKL